jgi:hypothetical protein
MIASNLQAGREGQETPARKGGRRAGDAISSGVIHIISQAIFYGKYQLNSRTCRQCGFEDRVPNGKMSDVNIATELLVDAFRDRFDTALLVSADGDLRGPVVATLREFPGKRVVVVFPPDRHSAELAKVASASFTLGRANLERSLFPTEVHKPDGYILRCPEEWK